MKQKEGTGKDKVEPPGVHINLSKQDQEDLARFRAQASRLTPRQKAEAIRRMLGRPDTP